MHPAFIVLIAICSLALLFALACFFIGMYFCNSTFKHEDWSDIYERTLKIHLPEGNPWRVDSLIDMEWCNAQRFDTWSMKSKDGLLLKASVLYSVTPSHKYVIVHHGYKSSPQFSFSTMYKLLTENGYNVVGVMALANVESEGHYFTMGNHESIDLALWAHEVVNRDKDATIALFGRSMGAHIVMASLNRGLPINVKCFIEDCGYGDLYEQLTHSAKDMMHLKFVPFLVRLGTNHLRIFHHLETKSDAKIALSQSDVPGLFIHGDKDLFVLPSNAKSCFLSLKCSEKQLVYFPGVGHCGAELSNKPLHDKLVLDWLAKYL